MWLKNPRTVIVCVRAIMGDSRNMKGIESMRVYAGIDDQKHTNTQRGLQDSVPRQKLEGILIKKDQIIFWARKKLARGWSWSNSWRGTSSGEEFKTSAE